jgi:hypothetical protein
MFYNSDSLCTEASIDDPVSTHAGHTVFDLGYKEKGPP